MYLETDVLVIGSGLAGLCAALCASEGGAKVVIAAKGRGATPNINGFQAWEDGTEEGLIVLFEQVMQAGCGLNDKKLVLSALKSSRYVYSDLERWGIEFLRDDQGNLVPKQNKGLILGYKTKGELGKQASAQLPWTLKEKGVIRLDNTEMLYPVLQDGRIVGAVGSRGEEVVYVQAKAVVVACGGIGSLFSRSTYPGDVCAGYVPIALLAGAELADMEFLQYEPAVCCGLPDVGYMPLPTKLWGCGAELINGDGEHFLPLRYGVTELALRKNGPLDKDLMARRIDTEIRSGRGTPNGGVWYDARQVEPEEIAQFTLKTRRLAAAHVDLCTMPVEICPGPHSHMGGIVVDERCASCVPGLYAAGEAASGFLGASRMSGFGGTSAAVLGGIAGRSAAKHAKSVETFLTEPEWDQVAQHAKGCVLDRCTGIAEGGIVVQVVRQALDDHYGIIKDAEGLKKGLDLIENLERTKKSRISEHDLPQQIREFGAVYAAKAMFTAALLREESRGAFFRSDYPARNKAWECSIVHHMKESFVLRTNIFVRD